MVIIIRGPSGSGKTMFADMIVQQGRRLAGTALDSLGSPWLRFSPDDYFAAGIPFSPSLLPEANRICLRRFARNIVMDVCDERDRPYNIVVDAPNVTVGDVSPYARLAAAYGHGVTILTMAGYGLDDAGTLSGRSARRTPQDVIERQMDGISRTRDAMRMFGRTAHVHPDLSWAE